MYVPPLQPSPLHIEHSWPCCSKIYFALLLTLCTLIHFNPLQWWMHILDIITLEFALNYIVFALFFNNHCTLVSSHCFLFIPFLLNILMCRCKFCVSMRWPSWFYNRLPNLWHCYLCALYWYSLMTYCISAHNLPMSCMECSELHPLHLEL